MHLRWLLPIAILGGASSAWAQTAPGAVMPVQPQIIQPQVMAPARVTAPEGMSIEDAVQWVLAQSAQESEEDLRTMMEAMQAQNRRRRDMREFVARTRAQRADMQAPQVTLSQTAQPTAPTVTPVAPPNPCAGSTAVEWQTCVDHIRTRLSQAQIPVANRARIERALATLRVQLTTGDNPTQPQFTRSQAVATNLVSEVQMLQQQ
ncbi:hypothetical protein [Terricaulis silvestris]|uniref:Secreted protein n=1 Tax=Terricaulis silvestris TaxID=2686094 RepID=A0A6I6MR76_9CAUL|nr:hypothetical protein [Terricaulis silvestris]QGZ94112.1 hypothetical protein DSM104635_00928 [Terricaulis silvestris]